MSIITPFVHVLGLVLRDEREKRGWSRDDLGGRLAQRITGETVGTYERAKVAMTVDRLAQIADALGVPVGRLAMAASVRCCGRCCPTCGTPAPSSPEPERLSPLTPMPVSLSMPTVAERAAQ